MNNNKPLIFSTVFILLIVVFVVAITVYQGLSSQTPTPTTTNEFQVSTSTTTNTVPSRNFIITRADNNATLSVNKGDEILVQLGAGTWQLSESKAGVLHVISNMPSIEGIQGLYKAENTGTTDLIAQNGSTSIKVTITVN